MTIPIKYITSGNMEKGKTHSGEIQLKFHAIIDQKGRPNKSGTINTALMRSRPIMRKYETPILMNAPTQNMNPKTIRPIHHNSDTADSILERRNSG
jgi:hypothetical protein